MSIFKNCPVQSISLLLLFSRCYLSLSQETFPPPEVPLEIQAQKVQDGTIDIDGILNETVWNSAQIVSGFTQREPVQGNPASYDTQVRILFDSKFLYIKVSVSFETLYSTKK